MTHTDTTTDALKDGLARVARHYEAGRYQAALDLTATLDEAHGPLAETMHLRGLSTYAIGDRDAGMELLKEAADFMPENGAIQADIGALLAQTGQYDEALGYFEEATKLAPHYAPGWSNLGAVHFARQDYGAAIRPLRKAVELDPNLADAQLNLATALVQAQRFRQAIDAYYKVLSLDPNMVAAHLGLSGALYRAERHDTALHHARKALELAPRAAAAHLHIGNALASMGQMEEAAEHLLTAANRPGGLGALSRLIHLRKTTADSPEFQRLTAILDRLEETPPDQDPDGVYFAAGKAFGDLKEYDRSADFYARGNAATAKRYSFDLQNHIEQVERMIAVASPALIERAKGAGVEDIAPIFVCGMPRSGTTLTELMLSRHSRVQAGGELNASIRAFGQSRRLVAHLEEKDPQGLSADELTQLGEFYLEAVRREGLNQEIITDKLPINHMYAGLLALALPRARFVILRRHPLDCCLSNWTQNFGRNQPFSTDFHNLGQVYAQYRRVTDNWLALMPDRMRLLSYEALVQDPEAEMRGVLNFCGLDWEPDVLDQAASSRTVNTASIAQVRQPIYQSARAKWHAYAAHLEPLAEEVDPWLTDEDRQVIAIAKRAARG